MDIDYIETVADSRDPFGNTFLSIGKVWGVVGARNYHDFESKEHAGGNDPKLYIEYTLLGWSGKISGVTNPQEVQGVDKADIAAVKGVA